ncbi:transposase family protein [Bacillus infantis]|uniref:transposase family protein n=1 Tax=Bacillus infantis TaxID=324767 RepID=UPI0030B86BAA
MCLLQNKCGSYRFLVSGSERKYVGIGKGKRRQTMGPSIPFPLPDPLLTVHSVEALEEKITFVVEPTTHSSICPACQTVTTRRHSRYSRAIQDLPKNNKQVELLLLTQKWFCDSPSCNTEVFTERYDWILPKKRRTLRAEELLRKLAFSTSCLNAEKLSKHLHLPVSHDTLLTLIRHTPDSQEVSPFRRH